MMGVKLRGFVPLPRETSLEDLVPKDHFYRRLEATLDLSFVRDLVRPLYACGGRPSVDPVIFFKLQLMMFFEDLRSERQLVLRLRFLLVAELRRPADGIAPWGVQEGTNQRSRRPGEGGSGKKGGPRRGAHARCRGRRR